VYKEPLTWRHNLGVLTGAHTDSKNVILRRHWWTPDGLLDRAAGSILEINSQLLRRQKTEPVTESIYLKAKYSVPQINC